jgi:DNA modification methylase
MTVRIITAHVMDGLRQLADESLHCCVTSPPYYGLRSYGAAPQVWGGDPDCSHCWGDLLPPRPGRGNKPGDLSTSSLTNPQRQDIVPRATDSGAFCHCGAWRGDLGLEPTLELFIQHLVEVFREVRRVLRKDGTLWLNIGDSYAGSGMTGGTKSKEGSVGRPGRMFHGNRRDTVPGCKQKDLLMIPAQLALALRADGWWLRSEIVWAKRAPMPESCTDRPTCAHEKIYLLSKSKTYYYDAEAVKEEADSPRERSFRGAAYLNHSGIDSNSTAKPLQPVDGNTLSTTTRNMRNWWLLGPEPFPEAHFATFVSEIPRRAILAGTSAKGVCPKCGAPWVRVVETSRRDTRPNASSKYGSLAEDIRATGSGNVAFGLARRTEATVETIGWRPSCSCDAGDYNTDCRATVDIDEAFKPIPATVLDPFLGSGTTALVADQLGRDCIGIELAPSYAEMARRRIADDAGMFLQMAAQ